VQGVDGLARPLAFRDLSRDRFPLSPQALHVGSCLPVILVQLKKRVEIHMDGTLGQGSLYVFGVLADEGDIQHRVGAPFDSHLLA
jgi:hypothetical protein